MRAQEGFLKIQQEQFDHAEESRFFWRTENPAINRTERDLLSSTLPAAAVRSLLEVGCGEGGNLVNWFATGAIKPELTVGVDLFYKKVQFASQQRLEVEFLCADAHALPFQDGVFDTILCRDILHHVEDPKRVVAELARLCAPAGQVLFLESNALNPLMLCQALVHRFERGLLRQSVRSLLAMMGDHFSSVKLEYRNPFPINRVMLHYQLGLAKLGYVRGVNVLMQLIEAALSRVLPRQRWCYLCLTASLPQVTVGRLPQQAHDGAPAEVRPAATE